MLTSQIYDHQARLRSYQLAAAAAIPLGSLAQSGTRS